MMPLAKLDLRYRVRELRELGVSGSTFRILWEAKRRSPYFEVTDRRPSMDERTIRACDSAPHDWTRRLWFTAPSTMRELMSETMSGVEAVVDAARRSARGRIVAFSDVERDHGDPIDWHRDPVTGERASSSDHWSKALSTVRGDVKDLWEPARFPQAYVMGRAATYAPALVPELSAALEAQVAGFLAANPFARGVHWASGQEVAFRLFAWTFGLHTLLIERNNQPFLAKLARHFVEAGVHLARHVDYARKATYNNHLLSEAAGLLLVAFLVPEATESPAFRALGLELMNEGVARQFYADGGYIQQAHNYHRVALQDLVWAASIQRADGGSVPEAWRDAALRSAAFLRAFQAPDGSLPNYGNNDGALVSPLTTCSYDDFRPVLQTVARVFGAEAPYGRGPWDEEARWFTGDAPGGARAEASPRSACFLVSGHHALRGNDAGSFAALRCGTLLDRFTQMDMLHLDVFWRGHNVLVDPGTFRYNGAPRWHAHFLGTSSHNTLVVDHCDQMVHFRQFKTLYPTEAKLLSFREMDGCTVCVGEHYGFARLRGQPIHRRAVMFVHDDLWVVVDTVRGEGRHHLRLHWLLGEFPLAAAEGKLVLDTPSGPFELAVMSSSGSALPVDVVRGQETPPRGWLSRRYGSKRPVPSASVEIDAVLPSQTVSILGGGPVRATRTGSVWSVQSASRAVAFTIRDGSFGPVSLLPLHPTQEQSGAS